MSYLATAKRYADDVLAGKIPAGLYVRLACERFRRDLERDDIVIDDDRDWPSERWCRFLERLVHTKGKWAKRGERFTLSPWQVFCTVNVYGWLRASDGLRRFREAYVEVPRKNGKSLWVAGNGLGHLVLDGEHGAEVFCGATTEAQAWEVFRPAREIASRLPALREAFGVEVNAQTLVVPGTASKFQPVIGNPGDGASPSCAIVDEFHEHATSDQVDTFTTGMGARDEPMLWVITTAGSDMGGPCYEKRGDAIDVLQGSVEDDAIFAVIYGLDEGDAWDTVEAQIKANPNYGVSVSADFLEGQLRQARRSATKQTAYRTKHLNQWVGARNAWMNMLAFQACRRRGLDLEQFRGHECIAALDLASTTDLNSLALVFKTGPEQYAAMVRNYLPEDAIFGDAEGEGVKDKSNRTRYQAWHKDGWITATPGNVIDYEFIAADLAEIGSVCQILEVPYDPFQATQFATQQLEDGVPMLEFGQTVRNFSEPMKRLEALILAKQIVFQMDPVTMWAFGNVVAKVDAKDNIFPRKERSAAKIDPVVAIIMALARWLMRETKQDPYAERGIETW